MVGDLPHFAAEDLLGYRRIVSKTADIQPSGYGSPLTTVRELESIGRRLYCNVSRGNDPTARRFSMLTRRQMLKAGLAGGGYALLGTGYVLLGPGRGRRVFADQLPASPPTTPFLEELP